MPAKVVVSPVLVGVLDRRPRLLQDSLRLLDQVPSVQPCPRLAPRRPVALLGVEDGVGAGPRTVGRADGCLEFERDALARELGKSRSSLGRCLRELAAKGICEVEGAPNQHRRSRLRIRAEYWPYEVAGEPAGRPAEDVGAYVAEVRRAGVYGGPLRASRRKLGGRLATSGRVAGDGATAILPGSVRKSMSLLDRPGEEPIRSLRYCAGLVEEVGRDRLPTGYWKHLAINLERCERTLQERTE